MAKPARKESKSHKTIRVWEGMEQPTKSTRTHKKKSPTKTTGRVKKTRWAGRTKPKGKSDVLGN